MTYIQHQDEISEQTIQIILHWMKVVIIQTKLFSKLWAEINQFVIYFTNISSTFTELYSELVENSITSYETWYEISYSHLKILKMIETKAVIHKENSELKKVKKLLEQDKKIILMRYKNWLIY